ncbi:hypothetical protein [Halospeciosus flavus]|uniref:Cox cluster protein n=1 Tax=Halospeciosus flavus TaxID=3032283 RepID=A0ABD5Z8T0_9EURY|nr:hypothetical protein [Halospeciosus flavus]
MVQSHEPPDATTESALSNRQQWLMVAVLGLSGLVVPLFIYAGVAGGPSMFGLPWVDTLVALPMVPALLLGAVGVWSAVRR